MFITHNDKNDLNKPKIIILYQYMRDSQKGLGSDGDHQLKGHIAYRGQRAEGPGVAGAGQVRGPERRWVQGPGGERIY